MEMQPDNPTKSFYTLNNCSSMLVRNNMHEFSNNVSVGQEKRSNCTSTNEQVENNEWNMLVFDIFEQMSVLKSSTVSNVNHNSIAVKSSENENLTEEMSLRYSKTKNYLCDLCNAIFEDLPEYHLHSCALMNNKYSSRNSTECDSAIENRGQFKVPGVECPQCHKLYSTKATLKRHQEIHYQRFPCMYCNYSCPSVELLNIHVKKKHSKVQCYIGDCLTKGTAQFNKLQGNEIPKTVNIKAGSVITKAIAHIKLLLTKKGIKDMRNCTICNEIFLSVKNLKWHLIQHVVEYTTLTMCPNTNGTLQLICQICHRESFNKIDSYKVHLAVVHVKMAVYKCNICAKLFINYSYFSKHKKVHNFF